MEIVSGNLFDSDSEVMVHQTNCIGLMGSGVAKEVTQRFPEVHEQYKKLCKDKKPQDLLGTVQFIKQGNIYIANLFGQLEVNSTWYIGGQVTDYSALISGFSEVRKFMEKNGLKRLGIPYLLGCCRGGGKWETVSKIIDNAFYDSTIQVTAYKL